MTPAISNVALGELYIVENSCLDPNCPTKCALISNISSLPTLVSYHSVRQCYQAVVTFPDRVIYACPGLSTRIFYFFAGGCNFLAWLFVRYVRSLCLLQWSTMRRNRVFSHALVSLVEPAGNGGILTHPDSRKWKQRRNRRRQSRQRSSEGAGLSSQEWRRLGRGCGAKLIMFVRVEGADAVVLPRGSRRIAVVFLQVRPCFPCRIKRLQPSPEY